MSPTTLKKLSQRDSQRIHKFEKKVNDTQHIQTSGKKVNEVKLMILMKEMMRDQMKMMIMHINKELTLSNIKGRCNYKV